MHAIRISTILGSFSPHFRVATKNYRAALEMCAIFNQNTPILAFLLKFRLSSVLFMRQLCVFPTTYSPFCNLQLELCLVRYFDGVGHILNWSHQFFSFGFTNCTYSNQTSKCPTLLALPLSTAPRASLLNGKDRLSVLFRYFFKCLNSF